RNGLRDLVHHLLVALNEGRFFQQVARRIAAHREFGKQNHLRAQRKGMARRVNDLFGITGEITNCWVDLPESNLHSSSLNRCFDFASALFTTAASSLGPAEPCPVPGPAAGPCFLKPVVCRWCPTAAHPAAGVATAEWWKLLRPAGPWDRAARPAVSMLVDGWPAPAVAHRSPLAECHSISARPAWARHP